MTPAEALALARAAVERVSTKSEMDLHGYQLSPDEAVAIRATLWDARGELARARNAAAAATTRADVLARKVAALETQADQLVAQVVSEEARAVSTEARLRRAERILRGLADDVSHTAHWREQARRFMEAR